MASEHFDVLIVGAGLSGIGAGYFLQQRCPGKSYVILENHLHLIVQAENLPVELARFKSFTARKLIDHLQERNAEHLLQQLAFFRKQHKQDREYQLWEEGSHPQLMENEEVLRQKLEYIHQNPVKRGYVDEAGHWRYSSARNYAGLSGLIPVYREWL